MEFDELQRALSDLHAGGDHEQALALLEEVGPGLDEVHRGRLVYWRACFTTLAGRPAAGLATLEGAFERGIWWDPHQLDRDPDLDAMRQLDGFGALRRRLVDHQGQAAASTFPELRVELPTRPVAEPCPVLLVLHGAWSSATRARYDWSGALEAGWALAMAQSSQPAGTDAFVWNDQPLALTELRGHVDTLQARGDVDIERGVLGGFSQGAALALLALLTDQVPMTRFIAQAPAFRLIDVDPGVVDGHPRGSQLEGVVLVGTADRGHDDAVTMAAMLGDRIGRCDLEVVDGLGHEAPVDIAERLRRWLAAWHPDR